MAGGHPVETPGRIGVYSTNGQPRAGDTMKDVLDRLRFRLARSRRARFEELALKTHQVYPQGSDLEPAFLAQPPSPGFTFNRNTPVASMGSCFAREIKDTLVERGYRYIQTEENRWSVHASCAWERVYGAVNAFHILDYTLSDEIAAGRLATHRDMKLDLLRNKVGYPDQDTAETDIRNHMRASRRALEQSEVLILTLGQNEMWRSRSHGFYYASRPPEPLVASGEAELRQLSVDENLEYLERFYSLFHQVNPRARLLVTLSPVPSLATFYEGNVVVRSSWNKAILRVAIGLFVQRHPEVLYFPSYEIVQTWRGNAFMADNRHVRRPVVSAIMHSFFDTYTDQ